MPSPAAGERPVSPLQRNYRSFSSTLRTTRSLVCCSRETSSSRGQGDRTTSCRKTGRTFGNDLRIIVRSAAIHSFDKMRPALRRAGCNTPVDYCRTRGFCSARRSVRLSPRRSLRPSAPENMIQCVLHREWLFVLRNANDALHHVHSLRRSHALPREGKKKWKAHKHRRGRAPASVASCVKGTSIFCNQMHASAQTKPARR
jgi:hypothetical protein